MKSLEELKAIRDKMQNQVNLRDEDNPHCGWYGYLRHCSRRKTGSDRFFRSGAAEGHEERGCDPDRLCRSVPVRAHRGDPGTGQGEGYIH